MGIVVPHLKKHSSGRIEFRRAYPPSLLPFIPGKENQKWAEHKVSLGLPDSPGFHTRHAEAIAAYDAIVSRARRMKERAFDPLDAPTIAYLAELFRVRALQRDEDARWTGRADYAGRLKEGLFWLIDDYRRWAAEGDVEAVVGHWGHTAHQLLQTSGKVIDPQDRDGFLRLCIALNAAAIGLRAPLEARLRGEVIPTPPLPENSLPNTKAKRPIPLLTTFDSYAAEAGISPGVRSEWRGALEKLIAFLTHDDASAISAADVVRWKDALVGEPTKRSSPRSPVTVNNKYLTPLRATLSWAVDQQTIPTNVASGIRARVPKQQKLRDRDFTNEEAQRILKASLEPTSPRMAKGHQLARRWIPWLCAYTGARVNEMSQLRTDDVQEIEGVHVVRITPEAGTTKTQEARIVPLHPHLIEQGFLEMVRGQAAGPLFYDPTKQRADKEGSRHYKKVGERLAEWVREDIGIKDTGIMPNHAWRHTFKTLARGAGIQDSVSDAITGHAPNTTGRKYGSVPLEAKVSAIRSLPRFTVDIP
ncbi:MAG: site-specific integrase [Sphingomonadales bacterium]|nr:site-specific integrase [Sphingomonadales bacterium]